MSDTQTHSVDWGKYTTNNEWVSRGKKNQVTAFKLSDALNSSYGKLIAKRLLSNRDVKILITSKGNTTGTGKTTLAVHEGRKWTKIANALLDQSNEFDAEENGFVSVSEYIEKYQQAQPGEVLITDELEYMVDNRRSPSHQNVDFSHAWQMLRYRNVITIATAPGLYTLDKRVLPNVDIWINVTIRGRANVYYVTQDDFTGETILKRFKRNGFKEVILWKDIPDGDPDYDALTSKKREIQIQGGETMYEKSDLEEAQKHTKEDVALQLLSMKEKGKVDLTQADIGDIVGMSQQWVYKLKRDKLNNDR